MPKKSNSQQHLAQFEKIAAGVRKRGEARIAKEARADRKASKGLESLHENARRLRATQAAVAAKKERQAARKEATKGAMAGAGRQPHDALGGASKARQSAPKRATGEREATRMATRQAAGKSGALPPAKKAGAPMTRNQKRAARRQAGKARAREQAKQNVAKKLGQKATREKRAHEANRKQLGYSKPTYAVRKAVAGAAHNVAAHVSSAVSKKVSQLKAFAAKHARAVAAAGAIHAARAGLIHSAPASKGAHLHAFANRGGAPKAPPMSRAPKPMRSVQRGVRGGTFVVTNTGAKVYVKR